MTKAQKRIVVAWCIAAGMLVIFPLYDGLISVHWQVLKWVVFAIFVLVAAFPKELPTRAERHAAFNKLLEAHPWVKVYMGVYAIVVALGAVYVVLEKIYITEHFILLIGTIVGLFLPVFVIKQREAWHEAGRKAL